MAGLNTNLPQNISRMVGFFVVFGGWGDSPPSPPLSRRFGFVFLRERGGAWSRLVGVWGFLSAGRVLAGLNMRPRARFSVFWSVDVVFCWQLAPASQKFKKTISTQLSLQLRLEQSELMVLRHHLPLRNSLQKSQFHPNSNLHPHLRRSLQIARTVPRPVRMKIGRICVRGWIVRVRDRRR